MLDEIHGAHVGESKSLSYARDYVFWPGMSAQVKIEYGRVVFAMRSETNRRKKHLSYTMFLASHGRLLALTFLSMVGTHTLLSLTFTQNFLNWSYYVEIQPRVSSTILRKFLSGMESLKRLSVITVPSIVMPETYSTVPMNSRCLQI